jgi:hypothetical protein
MIFDIQAISGDTIVHPGSITEILLTKLLPMRDLL